MTLVRWSRQPQFATGVDWGNQITRDLIDIQIPSIAGTLLKPVGGPTVDAGAVSGAQAFKGNGSSSYWFGNAARFNPGTPHTLLALVEGVPGANTYTYVFADASSTVLGLTTAGTTSRARFFLRTAAGDVGGGAEMTVANVFEAGIPHMIVLTYFPGTRAAYVDGLFDSSIASTPTPTDGLITGEVGIGALVRAGSAAAHASTKLYLGALWQRLLTNEEIWALYKQPWQLFAPICRPMFGDAAAAGGAFKAAWVRRISQLIGSGIR